MKSQNEGQEDQGTRGVPHRSFTFPWTSWPSSLLFPELPDEVKKQKSTQLGQKKTNLAENKTVKGYGLPPPFNTIHTP